MPFLHPKINSHFLISLNNQSVFTHCFPSGFLQWFCLKLSVDKVYTLHMSYLLNSPLSRAVPRQLIFNTTILWKVLNWFYRQIIRILNWSLPLPHDVIYLVLYLSLPISCINWKLPQTSWFHLDLTFCENTWWWFCMLPLRRHMSWVVTLAVMLPDQWFRWQ